MAEINFFLSEADLIPEFVNMDPDRDWQNFGSGISCWILQTYLRLKAEGKSVQLCSQAPQKGIVVVHADDLHNYFTLPTFSDQCLIVCVRADRSPQFYADIEIVQNRSSARTKHVHFIPHWPQPGFVPRDRTRGSRVENIVFKGAKTECHQMFEMPKWHAFLNEAGLHWSKDQCDWHGPKLRRYSETKWNDYSQVDVILAIRPDTSSPYSNKPASKLINAWRGGIPAILGPEVVFRELWQSELDYIEAKNLDQVIDGINRLIHSPNLYKKMVEHGLKRAEAFSPENILEQWSDLLFNVLVPFCGSAQWQVKKRFPVGIRYRYRKVLSKLKL